MSDHRCCALLLELTGAAVLTIDDRGKILEANDRALALLQRASNGTLGRSLQELLHEGDRDLCAQMLSSLTKSGRISGHVRLSRKGPEPQTIHCTGGRLAEGRYLLLLKDENEEEGRAKELQQRNREAIALYEIGRQIGSSFEVEQVLNLLVKNMCWLLECHFAGVALLDPHQQRLTWRATSGGRGENRSGSMLPSLNGAVSQVLETLKPSFIKVSADGQAGGDEELRGLLAEGLLSLVILPLAYKGHALGVLVGGFRQLHDLSADDMRFLSNLADHVALALENAQLYQSTLDDAMKLKALSSRLTKIQEEERGKISRELHDSVGQALTGIRFNLDLLGKEASITDGPARDRITGLQGIIDETLKDIRQMAFELRPSVLDDFGLAAALRQYVDRFVRHTGIPTRLVSPGEVRRCNPSIEATLYRVMQESLTNVAKHSRASEACVELSFSGHNLTLDVSDNGRGFDDGIWRRGATPNGGFGILNMRERVTELDGQFTCSSAPGTGTHIHVEIPIAP